ncbi:MAG: hypothetical protein KA230_10955, partial [Flavobacteriales bacterium]|nr:hypothetical protein [Flavobacteriales bacterium]
MRTVRNLVLAVATLFAALHGIEAKAQCAIPVVGCAGVNQADYGLASGTNAATIEYDNFVGSFHSTVGRNTSGDLLVWGELMANSGAANVLSPQVINSTNYPALTGTVLKASLGSSSLNVVQGVVLSTTGLFVWGTVGAVVPNTIAATTTFQKITVAGKADGLPVGVVPGDVKMMFVTYRTIAITTCSGSAYVLSQRANINQGGSTTAWVQIRTNQVGDPFITNVVAVRGSYGALVALKSDGTMWTWGEQTY